MDCLKTTRGKTDIKLIILKSNKHDYNKRGIIMKQKYYETCPKCGKKAILIKEIKTFDSAIKQYKCSNCGCIFQDET